MNLQQIYSPISKELSLVETEIKKMVSEVGIESSKEVFNYFFNSEGKYLRSALLIMSYRLVKPEDTEDNYKLIQLATAMELIHNASLIHDDIIDEDLTRRGQPTLNRVFGNKIAVLAGDILYSRVFMILSESFPKKFSQIICKVAEDMCMAEIEMAKNNGNISNIEDYYGLIRGKTAEFMKACCILGAELAGSNDAQIENAGKFGMNFGMTYQVVDDYLDDDENAAKFVTLKQAMDFSSKAKGSISELSDSVYKQSLNDLVDFVIGFTKDKQ